VGLPLFAAHLRCAKFMPNVTSIGGSSGNGSDLSNLCGKLYADFVQWRSEQCLEVMAQASVVTPPRRSASAHRLSVSCAAWVVLRTMVVGTRAVNITSKTALTARMQECALLKSLQSVHYVIVNMNLF